MGKDRGYTFLLVVVNFIGLTTVHMIIFKSRLVYYMLNNYTALNNAYLNLRNVY